MVLKSMAGYCPAVLSAAIVATAVSVGSSPVRGALDPKAAPVQEIVYTKAGSTELKLDLMSPTEGKGPFPAVVVITLRVMVFGEILNCGLTGKGVRRSR